MKLFKDNLSRLSINTMRQESDLYLTLQIKYKDSVIDIAISSCIIVINFLVILISEKLRTKNW